MAEATLAEATRAHEEAIEHNRTLGVIDYQSGEEKSDQVYEVTEGVKVLPGGIRLGPGQRFRPTVGQVRNGSLRGKARELQGAEYRDLRATRKSFRGADFEEMGRRAAEAETEEGADPWAGIHMADSTREFAIEAGLTPEDFRDLEAEGAGGRYTRAQVDAMAEERTRPEAGGGSPDPDAPAAADE